jgi:hypothetical protein
MDSQRGIEKEDSDAINRTSISQETIKNGNPM